MSRTLILAWERNIGIPEEFQNGTQLTRVLHVIIKSITLEMQMRRSYFLTHGHSRRIRPIRVAKLIWKCVQMHLKIWWRNRGLECGEWKREKQWISKFLGMFFFYKLETLGKCLRRADTTQWRNRFRKHKRKKIKSLEDETNWKLLKNRSLSSKWVTVNWMKVEWR